MVSSCLRSVLWVCASKFVSKLGSKNVTKYALKLAAKGSTNNASNVDPNLATKYVSNALKPKPVRRVNHLSTYGGAFSAALVSVIRSPVVKLPPSKEMPRQTDFQVRIVNTTPVKGPAINNVIRSTALTGNGHRLEQQKKNGDITGGKTLSYQGNASAD